MRQIGLFSRVKRKFVHTTDSNHTMAVAQNLLARDFTAEATNQKWVADITYEFDVHTLVKFVEQGAVFTPEWLVEEHEKLQAMFKFLRL